MPGVALVLGGMRSPKAESDSSYDVQTTPEHCAASPFLRATFPPPSIAPVTLIPKVPFLSAVLLAIVTVDPVPVRPLVPFLLNLFPEIVMGCAPGPPA